MVAPVAASVRDEQLFTLSDLVGGLNDGTTSIHDEGAIGPFARTFRIVDPSTITGVGACSVDGRALGQLQVVGAAVATVVQGTMSPV